MADKINMEDIISISGDVVSREIEGELIIIPLVAGVGDLEDDLFTLNESGKEIWKLLDGERTLDDITSILSEKFDSDQEIIKKDITGLITELMKRRMVTKI